MKTTLNVSMQGVHRIAAVMALAIVFWAVTTSAQAAPPKQYEGFVNSPRANAVVRGVVSIDGTANHPEFQKYEVRLAAGLNPNVADGQWIRLNISESPVTNGQLAVWDTTAVADGAYILRLRVVRLDSNYQDFDIAPINVANAVPPTVAPSPTPQDSPTPQNSPTPLATDTPSASPTSFVPGATVTPFGTPANGSTPAPGETPGAVATLAPAGTLPPTDSSAATPILIDQPTVVVATSTPEPDAVAVAPVPTRDPGASDGGDDNPFGIPGLPEGIPSLEAGTFTEPIVYGVVGTAAVFLAIGVIYIVRELLRALRR